MLGAAANTLGVSLSSDSIQKGLRELNPDFAFDVAVNRPGDWEHTLQFRSHDALEAMRKNRLPVLWRDRYISALDRGVVPEFKQWSVVERVVEIPWYEADKEDVSISFEIVHPWADGYVDLYLLASMGSDPGLQIMAGGGLYRMKCMGYKKVRGGIVAVGWRHTFERILRFDIPGVTRETLGLKFGVDMLKYPVGAPDELVAALVTE